MAPSDDATLARRLRSQLLSGRPARRVDEVVSHLLAVQAQDGRGARLAARARSSGLLATAVDEALAARRLVVSTLNRGTLHLVAAADYWWLHRLTTPQLATTNARRLRQEGVSTAQAEKGVATVAAALSEGPHTRSMLRARLDDAGVPTAGQAIVHVLLAATLAGVAVRGPMAGTDQAFVAVEQWLGPPPQALGREDALARLAQRYLVGHGPAEPEDLAKWAGVTLTAARQAMASAPPVRESGSPLDLPEPRLLGPFDPLLHGWVSRDEIVGAHRGVVTTNGIFRPVALVGGRVVALWSLASGVVTLEALSGIGAGDREALAAEATDVLRYLGLPDRPLRLRPITRTVSRRRR